ncbi:MAG: hypothetical protein CO017_07010 [Zetaproteobacteria bacterium CG_4_8_14_3_um_filter_59_5]|nr:MAG: hypothetical protein COX56_07695 [Zetaproteobacteria bacterium CG23_combo_of_CG06-09_8_20_14_all_59_86]PIU97012.1 MAG: hypothetical protein COS62_06375 [Zetaproteobacteria bacterium CG03_land_8_20_14_0_80_59_51]PJC69882.1 MAG: hypothetical protein CO017_07010 [Zetaproteobacteria bacterium CG_4_8_14_3_um_filter_59_5]HCS12925.1 hypothetical protein [Zetaproteobacteria bacterium]
MSQTNRRRAPTRSVVSPRRVLFGLLRGMALASVACLLLAAGWWLNQALAVQSWQVHGVPEALETAIDKQLNDMQPLDLAHAWPSLLRSRLLDSLPDLAEVNISRHLPDRLEISASMRMPVALWSDTSGTVQLVDGHGLAYRPLKPGEGLDLPVLRVPADEVKQSVALMLRLKQMDDARYATLSEWIAEPDGWKLNFDRGRCWLLPKGDGAAERIGQVMALMQDHRWKDGDWRVDVRASTRWFIRKSKLGGMV